LPASMPTLLKGVLYPDSRELSALDAAVAAAIK
jgi:hypothetical protein